MTPQASVLLNDSLVENVCCVTEALASQPKFDLHGHSGDDVYELRCIYVCSFQALFWCLVFTKWLLFPHPMVK